MPVGKKPKRCFCCGVRPVMHTVYPERCPPCFGSCRILSKACVERGPACPFLRRFKETRISVTELRALVETIPSPPDTLVPTMLEKLSSGVPDGRVFGAQSEEGFLWRNRIRKNVPGG